MSRAEAAEEAREERRDSMGLLRRMGLGMERVVTSGEGRSVGLGWAVVRAARRERRVRETVVRMVCVCVVDCVCG